MGRITIFTTEDINSRRLLKEFDKRKLPYEVISLSDRPSRINDLKALGNGPAVPQVFFNNDAVGGLDKCKKELKAKWDNSSRFGTPLDKYKEEVASQEDPDDPCLAPSPGGYKVIDPPPAPIQPNTVVKLPSGKAVPLREATELMKMSLPPMEQHKYKGRVQKNCFSGQSLVHALVEDLEISENLCKRFLERLMKAHVLHHVDREHFPDDTAEFQDTNKDFYRFQCHETPEILNSYRLWPKNARRDCVTVVEDLQKRLLAAEMSSLDDEGLIDYRIARDEPAYCMFEDAVCELQEFSMDDLTNLDVAPMTALALNVYWIMLRYAFLKVGIPINESDRTHFMKHVKFYLAGETFTMSDWVDVLRGKSKQFKNVMKKDVRIVCAMHMGAHNGSSWSSPFSRFTVDNLEEELNVAAATFCRDSQNVAIRRDKVKLSSVFKQYRSDFGKDDKSVLRTILAHSTGKQKEEIELVLSSKEGAKVSYREPELGFHTASGPWYNNEQVQTLHKQQRAAGKTHDPLGHSGHSVTSFSSNYSGSLSWL